MVNKQTNQTVDQNGIGVSTGLLSVNERVTHVSMKLEFTGIQDQFF